MRLADKVVVITGASAGIGQASARLFAAEGARLMLGDVNVTDGQRLADELAAAGHAVAFLATDVTVGAQVKRLVDSAVERYGRLDAIFNNAGIGMRGSVTDLEEADFDRVININLKGVFFGCKYALPHLLANPNGGVILNMSSNGGVIGRPGDPVYNASKHGVMGLTKSLALNYADQRIRVNAVCPGPIDTPLFWQPLGSGDRDAYLHAAVASCPTPRAASAHEVATAALFLVSDDSSFITGVGLPVDGGKAAGVFKSDRYRMDFQLQ